MKNLFYTKQTKQTKVGVQPSGCPARNKLKFGLQLLTFVTFACFCENPVHAGTNAVTASGWDTTTNPATARAALTPTNQFVLTDTNGALASPTNFFTANSAAIAGTFTNVTDTNALHATNNLSDLTNPATARANLGLSNGATTTTNLLALMFQAASATLNSWASIATNTVAYTNQTGPMKATNVANQFAGNGTGLTNVTDLAALHAASNLLDVASIATTRANLGLGTAATNAAAAFQPAATSLTSLANGNAAALTNYSTNIFDPVKFGVVFDGVTDSTIAMSNLWAALIAFTNSADVIMPPGIFVTRNWTPFIPATSPDGTFYQYGGLDNNFQVSHHRIKGAGPASTFWVSYVTNCNFISITNAGIQFSDLAIVRAGGLAVGGTNTAIAQFGGNGNGEAAYDNVTFKGWTTGVYANSFCTRITGHFNDCGNGIIAAGQSDGLTIDAFGWGNTNAIAVLLGGTAFKVHTGGTANNYGVMVGPGATAEISGEVESQTNAFVTMGLPGYMLSNYTVGTGQPMAYFHDLHMQSSGTNPLVKLFTNSAVTLGPNISYAGSGSSPILYSANTSGDLSHISVAPSINPFLGFSSGAVMGVNGDPLRNGYSALINNGFAIYSNSSGTNAQLAIDPNGNITTYGAVTAGSFSVFSNGFSVQQASGGFGIVNFGGAPDGINPNITQDGSHNLAINMGSGGMVINNLGNNWHAAQSDSHGNWTFINTMTISNLVGAGITASADVAATNGTGTFKYLSFAGGSGTPTIVTNATGGGSGATASIVGNDVRGVVTITTGTGTAAGLMATVLFSQTKPLADSTVVMFPASATAALNGGVGPQRVYVTNFTAASFEIRAAAAIPASTAYSWTYLGAQ